MKKQVYRFSEWTSYVRKKDTPLSFENSLYYSEFYNQYLDFETNYINCMKHYGYYIYKIKWIKEKTTKELKATKEVDLAKQKNRNL